MHSEVKVCTHLLRELLKKRMVQLASKYGTVGFNHDVVFPIVVDYGPLLAQWVQLHKHRSEIDTVGTSRRLTSI